MIFHDLCLFLRFVIGFLLKVASLVAFQDSKSESILSKSQDGKARCFDVARYGLISLIFHFVYLSFLPTFRFLASTLKGPGPVSEQEYGDFLSFEAGPGLHHIQVKPIECCNPLLHLSQPDSHHFHIEIFGKSS